MPEFLVLFPFDVPPDAPIFAHESRHGEKRRRGQARKPQREGMISIEWARGQIPLFRLAERNDYLLIEINWHGAFVSYSIFAHLKHYTQQDLLCITSNRFILLWRRKSEMTFTERRPFILDLFWWYFVAVCCTEVRSIFIVRSWPINRWVRFKMAQIKTEPLTDTYDVKEELGR